MGIRIVGNANTTNAQNLIVNGTVTVGEYTLPATDGEAGQVLQTDGNGNLTWVTL